MYGRDTILTWSSDPVTVALRRAEAELHSTTEGSVDGVDTKSPGKYMGVDDFKIVLHSDSSAALCRGKKNAAYHHQRFVDLCVQVDRTLR